MKKISPWIILIACSGFVILHFYNLSHYLINFPTWGDDYLFFAYFNDLPILTGRNFWEQTLAFHSNIHRIAIARMITACYALFHSSFDFKELTLWTNTLWITAVYPFYQLIKKYQLNPWQLIPIVGLLLAPNGNVDNFTLIGVLQHSTSLAFLVWVSYLISEQKTFALGIWLSLLYPLFSTEGIAFIPLIFCLLLYLRDTKIWLYGLLGAAVIWLYFYGYNQPELSAHHGSMFSKILLAAEGALIFIGGALKKDLFLAIFTGLFLFGHALYVAWRYHQTKNSALLFCTLLFFQLMLVGAMISVGRTNDSGQTVVLFSDRFSTYGTLMLLATYFSLLLPENYPWLKRRQWVMAPALVWIGLSSYVALPKFQNLHNHLVVDASNAFYFHLNSSYPFGKREENLLKYSGRYAFPKELLQIPNGKATEVKLQALAEMEPEYREYAVQGRGAILVYEANKPKYFLAINQISHTVKIKKDAHWDQRTSLFIYLAE